MSNSENPLDTAERIIKELEHVLELDQPSRAILKGYLIAGLIAKNKVSTKPKFLRMFSEVPVSMEDNALSEVFVIEAESIVLDGNDLTHSSIRKLSEIAIQLDVCGTVIAGEDYMDPAINEWMQENNI